MINGLETALNLFLILILIYFSLKLSEKNNIGCSVLFGVISGLVILARTDSIIFVLAATSYILINKKFSSKQLFYAFLSVFILGLPWVVWNYLTFGTIMQASGQSYMLITKSITILDKGASWGLIESVKTHIFMTYQGILSIGRLFGHSNSVFLISGIILGFILLSSDELKKRNRLYCGVLGYFLSGGFVYFIVHSLIRWTMRPWYFVPIFLLIMITFDCFFEIYIDKIRYLKSVSLLIFVIALPVLVFGFRYNLYNRATVQRSMLVSARYIKENLPESRFGSFNAGIIGYFSHRGVVNLDGLINNSAYHALKDRNLYDYLKENEIDYILDNNRSVDYRFRSFMGREMSEVLTKEKSFEVPGVREGFAFSLYKIIY